MSFFRYAFCMYKVGPPLARSHLLGRALLAQHDVAQVHQVGQQVVGFVALADQIATARVPGGSRAAGHHFVPAGSAPAHRRWRRDHTVERSRHGIYYIRGGRAAGPLHERFLARVVVTAVF